MTSPEERELYEAKIAEAKEIAVALILAHAADVNAMSGAETVEAQLRMEGDVFLTQAVVRTLAGAAAAMATAHAARTTERGTAAFAERTGDLVRGGIERLNYDVY